MPVITFDSEDAIPEGLKEVATKTDDGKFSVKVVPEAKLNEFREKNITLAQQLETLSPIMARVKNIAGDDLDAFENSYSELRAIAQKVQDGELKTSDDIEKAVAERVKAVKDGYETTERSEREKRVAAETESKSLKTTLEHTNIRHEITAAVISADSGVRPEALPDVLERSYKLFHWKDGKPVPMNGESTIFGPNGADPMTPKEWLVKLRDEAPHYFKANGGGGAAGGTALKGGITSADLAKMTPEQKLAYANR